MRRYIPFFVISLVFLIVYFNLSFKKGLDREYGDGPPARPNQATDSRTPPPRPPAFPEKITLLPAAATANRLHAANTTIEDDLSIIHSLLRSHRRALGSNPVGFNDEITAALAGKNIKGAASLADSHPAISDRGELLDRWGTPYKFHAFSGKLMEIRSAGPDNKFFTNDDQTLTE